MPPERNRLTSAIETRRETRPPDGLALTWDAVTGAMAYAVIVGLADAVLPPLDVLIGGATREFALLGVKTKVCGVVDLGSPVGEERQYALVAYLADGTLMPVPNVRFTNARAAPRDREYHTIRPPELVRSSPPPATAPSAAPVAPPASGTPWDVLERRDVEIVTGISPKESTGVGEAWASPAPRADDPFPTPVDHAPAALERPMAGTGWIAKEQAPQALPPALAQDDPWSVLVGAAPAVNEPPAAPLASDSPDALPEPSLPFVGNTASVGGTPVIPATIEPGRWVHAHGDDRTVARSDLDVTVAQPDHNAAEAETVAWAGNVDANAMAPSTHANADTMALPAHVSADADAGPIVRPETDAGHRAVQPDERAGVPASAPPPTQQSPAIDVDPPVQDSPASDVDLPRDVPGEWSLLIASQVPEDELPAAVYAPLIEAERLPDALPHHAPEGIEQVPMEATTLEHATMAAGLGPSHLDVNVDRPVNDAVPIAPVVGARTETPFEQPAPYAPAMLPWDSPPSPSPAPDIPVVAKTEAIVEAGEAGQALGPPPDDEQAAAIDPARVTALLDEAELYLLPQWLDLATARGLVAEAVAADPGNPRARGMEQQLAALTAAGSAAPHVDVEALLAEATTVTEAGDYWRAVDLYEQAQGLRPERDDIRVRAERARVLARWTAQVQAAGGDPRSLQRVGDEFAAAAPDLAARAYHTAFEARPTIVTLRAWLLALARAGEQPEVGPLARDGVDALLAAGRITRIDGAVSAALATLEQTGSTPEQATDRPGAIEDLAGALVASAGSAGHGVQS